MFNSFVSWEDVLTNVVGKWHDGTNNSHLEHNDFPTSFTEGARTERALVEFDGSVPIKN